MEAAYPKKVGKATIPDPHTPLCINRESFCPCLALRVQQMYNQWHIHPQIDSPKRPEMRTTCPHSLCTVQSIANNVVVQPDPEGESLPDQSFTVGARCPTRTLPVSMCYHIRAIVSTPTTVPMLNALERAGSPRKLRMAVRTPSATF